MQARKIDSEGGQKANIEGNRLHLEGTDGSFSGGIEDVGESWRREEREGGEWDGKWGRVDMRNNGSNELKK